MTTQYLARDQWATKNMKPATTKLNPDKVVGLSIHYPGSGNEELTGLSKAQVVSRIRGWYEYHTLPESEGGHGWSDIGYQVAIDGIGRVWDLRGINIRAAATGEPQHNYNNEWGACLFIVGDHEQPTDAQLQAFQDFYHDKWLEKYPNADKAEGHTDVGTNATSCPGTILLAMCRDGSITKKDEEEIVDASTVVGTKDHDGSPITMGEVASRITNMYGIISVDSDGTDSLPTRLGRVEQEQKEQRELLDKIFAAVSPKK